MLPLHGRAADLTAVRKNFGRRFEAAKRTRTNENIKMKEKDRRRKRKLKIKKEALMIVIDPAELPSARLCRGRRALSRLFFSSYRDDILYRSG